MKNILKGLFLVLGAAAIFSACTSEKDYDWANPEAGLKLYFDQKAPTAYELEENQSSVSFWVYRNTTAGDLTVDINAACVTSGAAEDFTVPTQAVFKDGESKARVRVLYKFSDLDGEKEYKFSTSIKVPENYSVYGPSTLDFTVAFYPEWDNAGKATMMNVFFGATGEVQLQRKPGTNTYRVKSFMAQLLNSLSDDDLIADEWISSASGRAAFIDEVTADGASLIFSLTNDYKFADLAAQDPSSTLYGDQIEDGVGGTLCYFTANNSANASHIGACSSTISGHTYAINGLGIYGGLGYYNYSVVFDWHTNAYVPASEWNIVTDYNADFSYGDMAEAAFTSKGFPAASGAVKVQSSEDTEGLFYIPNAYGVSGFGLAFYMKNNQITIPAGQPTGVLQQGMMVYAAPGGESKLDGVNYNLNIEYYMTEVTKTPVEPSDDDADDPGTLPKPSVPDPNDPAYVWPSGQIGVGERFEKVADKPVVPKPEPEQEFTTTTRRISIGSFEEKVAVTAASSIDDFVGNYSLAAANVGVKYLGEDIQYYPDVKAAIALNVAIAKGEAENEVIITGLFSGAVNGDYVFDPASIAGKDVVKGVYNKLGSYILIYPQTLSEPVVFPGGDGKPDRKFNLTFTTFDTGIYKADVDKNPLKLSVGEGNTLILGAASLETGGISAYTFYSSYSSDEPVNYDIPAKVVLTKK